MCLLLAAAFSEKKNSKIEFNQLPKMHPNALWEGLQFSAGPKAFTSVCEKFKSI